jgi:hypothetical protein
MTNGQGVSKEVGKTDNGVDEGPVGYPAFRVCVYVGFSEHY